jgi:hypothetical protein
MGERGGKGRVERRGQLSYYTTPHFKSERKKEGASMIAVVSALPLLKKNLNGTKMSKITLHKSSQRKG